MKTSPSTSIGRIAIAVGVAAILGLVFIVLFYALYEGAGGPFGTLNDICVALGAILSGGLAWVLYPMHRSYAPRWGRFALGSAWVGACLAAIGSGFAIFDVNGIFCIPSGASG